MNDRFSRTAMLFGQDAMDKLKNSRVAVFGIGGVGGYVVEALARSGVGALDLIDSDRISPSNINRQIIAAESTVGLYKTEAAAARVRDINPDCAVVVHNIFFMPENSDDIDFSAFDYVVDAIDTVVGKLALIERAYRAGTPVISSMGAGNKVDPTAFEVADIYATSMCPLAKIMRKELKKRGIKRLKVVYSKEEPKKPIVFAEDGESSKMPIASVAFVPSVAGLIMAGEVIKDIVGYDNALRIKQ